MLAKAFRSRGALRRNEIVLHYPAKGQQGIQDEANAAVVRATTALAHALDRKVCTEGVETDEAWHRVRALGCDVVQGFLIAKPMSPKGFGGFERSLQQ